MPDAGKPHVAQPLPRIGSYQLIQQLGSGGMSSVFRAIHTETGHEVAVKVLPRYLAKNPTLLQRFLREAKSAEALEHPNIVAIYDRGSEEGRYYLVLEYVPGGDLHDRVRNKGPLGVAEVIELMRAVARGLQFAAGRGLIHRDIKPANLLVDPDGQVKITDLGLALQVEEEDERVTRDGTTVGTVDYMSPEQARDSRATSIRSDIYSLGCTCYFLLTGTPPFPGGDVAEKLRAHAQDPRPDVRDRRPDVPEPLARLIQKMMARRPEDRFPDHDSLLTALEVLPLLGGGPPRPAAGEPPPLYALIDEDDEDKDFVVDAPGPGLAAPEPDTTIEAMRPRPASKPASSSDEVNLSALAALEGDEPPRAPAYRLRPPAPAVAESPPQGAFDLDAEAADAEAEAAAPGRPWGRELSLRSYIVRGLVLGLALALAGLMVQQLASLAPTPASPPEEVAPEGTGPSAPPLANASPPRPSAKAKPAAPPAPAPVVARAWVEPAETPPADVPEPSYPAEWEGRTLPEWARAPVPERIDGPFVTVRRVGPARDVVPDLRQAFNLSGGTVEVADDGPFFEQDVRITGTSRLIRARRGTRPMLAIGPPTLDFYRRQPAVFVVENSRVILDGLDLIIRADELPRNQSALFACRGGELVLRNCTVTVVGSRPFDLVQVGEPFAATPGAPSRVRLERTFVRGAAVRAVRLGGDPAEVAVDRSVLLCGGGPAVAIVGRPAGPRQVAFARSVVAARGPILEVGAPPGSGSPPPRVRALGTTFARIDGAGDASLIALRDDGGVAPREAVDWAGFDDLLAGFDGWLSAGHPRVVKVADLAAARAAWPGSGEQSREQPAPWPESSALDEATPAALKALAPGREATLARVASPSPFLWQKTLGRFRPQAVSLPDLEAAPAPAGIPAPGVALIPGVNASINRRDSPGVARTEAAPDPEAPLAPGELLFDVNVAPWFGDIGQFLAATIKPGTRHARVRVRGGGPHEATPFRAPDGVSIEILAEPNPAGVGPLLWAPRAGATGEALFETHGGDLSITGAWLARTRPDQVRYLVRVEDGLLTLSRCKLTTPMAVEPAFGGLVAFRAAGTGPLPGRPAGADRPVCRLDDCVLISGGTAITAELGRGVVALRNCALTSGSDAMDLRPQRVRRDRFEADLWLERCTVVAERSFVRLGPWPGAAPGPDRPWLVATDRSAFLDAFGPRRRSALLRADTEALAQCALLWQARGDAYDVSHFAASADAAPEPSRAAPDVRRHWVEFWGKSHIVGVAGPGRGTPGPGIRLIGGPLVGEVGPDALALDPRYPPGRKALDVGADTRRFQSDPSPRPTPPARPATAPRPPPAKRRTGGTPF
jgi:eukaryotic-like serine/threonine-protein kinase